MADPTTGSGDDPLPGSRVSKDYKKRPGACEHCKLKKFRCDGARPKCQRCERDKQHCQYLPCKRRGGRTKAVPLSSGNYTAVNQPPESSRGLLSSNPQVPQSMDKTSRVSWPSPWLPTPYSDVQLPNNGSIPSVADPSVADTPARGDESLRLMAKEISDWTAMADPAFSAIHTASDVDWSQYVHVHGPHSSTGSQHNPSESTHETQSSSEISSCAAQSQGHRDNDVSRVAEWKSFAASAVLDRFITTRHLGGYIDDALADTIRTCMKAAETASQNSSKLGDPTFTVHMVAARRAMRAFCAQPHWGATYVHEEALSQIADTVFVEGSTDRPSIVLVHSAIAIGLVIDPSAECDAESTALALSHYTHALSHARQIRRREASALSFKAIITLLVAALHLSTFDVEQLLEDASVQVRTLGLEFDGGEKTLRLDSEEQDQLKIAFWLLYCIEKLTRMEAGLISVFADVFIYHDPPIIPQQLPGAAHHEFSMHIRLARLCSRMLEKLYSRPSFFLTGDAITREVQQCVREVKIWMEEAHHDSFAGTSLTSLSTTWRLLTLLLCIQSRSPMEPSGSSHCVSTESCVLEASESLLDVLIFKDATKAHMEPLFLRAVVSAFCIAACFCRKGADTHTTLRRMGFALGFLARLPPGTGFPWDLAAKVLSLIQRSLTAPALTC